MHATIPNPGAAATRPHMIAATVITNSNVLRE
jgi:hypothetical protein